MKKQKIEVGNEANTYSWWELIEDGERVLKAGTYNRPFPNEEGNSDAFGIVEALLQSDYCPFAFIESPIAWVKIQEAE
jgi:hypothetical protein